MYNTQRFIPIEEIKENLVFLKNGGVSMIITTSAVNFALLFETEQLAIIESFAGFLNSLNFPIQIVVRSKRMDVTSYLDSLEKAMERQKNPLIVGMTQRYKKYVESLIKENNVLDKKFYICISVTSLELGVLSKSIDQKIPKAQTILMPRRDHLIRQLTRIGLRARQLENKELIGLFYDIYNPTYLHSSPEDAVIEEIPITEEEEPIHGDTIFHEEPQNPFQVSTIEPADIPQQEVFTPPTIETVTNQQELNKKPSLVESTVEKVPFVKNLAPPFAVEELIDEIWPSQSER